MGQNNITGAWGEQLAAKYLRKKKYKVVATNFHCRYGEIDLIVSNRYNLVFVEVKLRKSDKFARASEHVDKFKQERIRTTAEYYLTNNPTNLQPRFDVIEIYAPDGIQSLKPEIYHMEDAF